MDTDRSQQFPNVLYLQALFRFPQSSLAFAIRIKFLQMSKRTKAFQVRNFVIGDAERANIDEPGKEVAQRGDPD